MVFFQTSLSADLQRAVANFEMHAERQMQHEYQLAIPVFRVCLLNIIWRVPIFKKVIALSNWDIAKIGIFSRIGLLTSTIPCD